MTASCVFCKKSIAEILCLGLQPASNRFLREGEVDEYAHPLTLGRCVECGLLQLVDPMPSHRLVPRFDWIHYNEPETHLDDLVNRIMLSGVVDNEDAIGGLTYKDESTLERFSNVGFRDTRTIDPGKDLGIGHKNAGLETIQEHLTPNAAREFVERNGGFQLLVARHILEHSHDPTRFLEAVQELVVPGGYVLFEVPDFSKCLRNHDYCFLWEEHTVYFLPQTLKATFSGRRGFTLVDMWQYEYPFENSLIVLLRLGEESKKDGTSRALPDETSLSFAGAFHAHKKDVQEVLACFRQTGKEIAVFGAGHLACKFINFYELSRLVDFVVDDHPAKQGLHLPGSRLPIVGSSEIDSRPIGLVVMSLSPESEARVMLSQAERVAKGIRFVSMFESSDRALLKERLS